jgi:hypothetical protein
MRSPGDIIFLLGAGASMDAGMPSIVNLTRELCGRLSTLSDWAGKVHPEFPRLFTALAALDPSVTENYERLFEWLELLIKVQGQPYQPAFLVNIPANLAGVASARRSDINRPICKIFHERRKACTPESLKYLERLRDFIPDGGRLPVFTLNYDLTVEDACRNAEIRVTTGFRGDWCPSLFQGTDEGINLYKMHGSLSWFAKSRGGGVNRRQRLRRAQRICWTIPANSRNSSSGPGASFKTMIPSSPCIPSFTRHSTEQRLASWSDVPWPTSISKRRLSERSTEERGSCT